MILFGFLMGTLELWPSTRSTVTRQSLSTTWMQMCLSWDDGWTCRVCSHWQNSLEAIKRVFSSFKIFASQLNTENHLGNRAIKRTKYLDSNQIHLELSSSDTHRLASCLRQCNYKTWILLLLLWPCALYETVQCNAVIFLLCIWKMIGVAWLSCQSFQRTLCVEASVIARDILLVFILEFLQMLQIVSNWAMLRPSL